MFKKILQSDININSKFAGILFVVLYFLSFLLICYFHPTSEKMFCDSNFNCSVEKIYLYKIHLKEKHIKLNANSSVNYIIKKYDIPMRSQPPSYNYYWIYDNTSPFVYYSVTSNSFDNEYIKTRLLNEQKNFSAYLKNPKKGYQVGSMANSDSLNFSIAIYMVFLIFGILFMFQGKFKFLDFIFNHDIRF